VSVLLADAAVAAAFSMVALPDLQVAFGQ